MNIYVITAKNDEYDDEIIYDMCGNDPYQSTDQKAAIEYLNYMKDLHPDTEYKLHTLMEVITS